MAGRALLLGATLAAAVPSAAFAAPPAASASDFRALAILVLSGEKLAISPSEIYSATRREIERETVLEVAGPDVLAGAVREEAVRRCAGNGRCFARALREAGVSVDLLLTVSADRLAQGVLLGLRLVDVAAAEGGAKADIAAVGDDVPNEGALLDAIANSVSKVFPPTIWGQIARVEVTTDPAAAEVSIAGHVCVSPCAIDRLKPGPYELAVTKRGFAPVRKPIELVPHDVRKLDLELTSEDGGILTRWWLWGAVGAAAVATGVVVGLAASGGSGGLRVCLAKTEAECN